MSCQNSAYILHRVYYLIMFSPVELFILSFYCGLVNEVLNFMPVQQYYIKVWVTLIFIINMT